MRRWNMGWHGPNPYPFCRCNPALPSRRAMSGYFGGGIYGNYQTNEVEYLKNTAEYLENQLDEINKRLKDIEKED
ncbi:DUF5320 domain-containing protein [Lutispora sp.]|uniref:DUF5320 domain-containing protein n=1 Tax=Lutispora sp. TaxID=2828727 RepID=UPI0035625700